MNRRQRKTFRGAGLESLEGRELLSHASLAALAHSRAATAAMLGTTHQSAAQIRAQELQMRRQLAATVLGQASLAGVSTPSALIASPATSANGGNPALGAGTAAARASLAKLSASSQVATGVVAVTPTNPTSVQPASVQYSQGLPTTKGGTAAATTVTSTSTGAPTTTTTSSPTSPTSTVSPAVPVMPPAGGMLGNLTLSPTDLTQLNNLAQQFASSYTGTGSTADATAVSTFQSGLNTLSQNVWSETHVASASSVAALQSAVNTFAGSYTSGQTPSTDNAAWTALGSAFQTFATSLSNPEATSGATTTANPVPTSPSPALAGNLVNPMNGPGLASAFAPLFSGPSLTKAEATQLGTIVSTFTTAYKATVPSSQSPALTAFQTSLSGLVGSHLGASSGPAAGTQPTTAMAPFQGVVNSPMIPATTAVASATSTTDTSATTTASTDASSTTTAQS